jgi:hypothetical protein
MKTAVIFAIGILSGFTAIGLACAVRISLRRPPAADPFFHPFGDMPGFTAEQLARVNLPVGELLDDDSPVCTGDPLRRSFAPRVLSPRAVEELRRSLADRWPHSRRLYSGHCIRCGASTTAEFAADCISDPWNSTGLALRPDAGGGFSSIPSGLAAVRNFFRSRRHG